MSHLLEAWKLEQQFDGKRLWQIEQLTWLQGESIHLVGVNGSGKTTLMKVLSGLIQPTHGKLLLDNRQLKAGTCCYLHQHPYMFDKRVEDNLRLVAIKGVSRQAREERIKEALNWAGLEHKAHQQARTLSGGERQRLAMARAWLLRPAFWLLDEPAANLDTDAVEQLVTLIRSLQEQGAGILLSSHQTTALSAICEQRWVLSNGQLLHY
ncbi:ABC transporter ATP-binding protein [Nitrincola sp. MINF-07-Sa-05]|uniref:ABC transporter ATP-binding protein n=1 Tax=Nitrincola salilacus TaxID=3400273 RepID=UPI00391822A7